MAFRLLYNELFPLRPVNFAAKYLECGGTMVNENKTVSQLSKLQVIDFFYPSLFVIELPESEQEAYYDYRHCCIYALRKQGVLSNQGSWRQKINNLEDCLLGNSRNERTFKNYGAAHDMLRKAQSVLISDEKKWNDTVSNLKDIYDRLADSSKEEEAVTWMGQMISRCHETEIRDRSTLQRDDGLFFDPHVYDSLLSMVSSLYQEENFRACWIWLCLGSLFCNYIEKIMETYSPGFTPLSPVERITGSYRLVSGPLPMIHPYDPERKELIEQIHSLFVSGNHAVFLYGIDGTGKHIAARQYAIRYRNQYDVIIHAVYETDIKDLIIADQPFELSPSLARAGEESDDDYFRRKLNIIKKSAAQRTLIIIENFNADNDENLNELTGGRYRLLITGRTDRSRDYHSIHVDALENMDDLINIFMANYRGYAVSKDDPDLASLLRITGCHTYTAILLARHMENSGQSAKEMLEVLEKEGLAALNEVIRMDQANECEAYQFLLKMFRLTELSKDEQYVMKLLSLISPDGMEASVFRKWAKLPSNRSLLFLQRQSLIIRKGNVISLHPVIRLCARYCLSFTHEEIQPFLNSATEAIANENSWHFTKEEKEQYCQLVLSILSCLKGIDEYTAAFYQASSVLLGFSGHPAEAAELNPRLYEYRLAHDGEDAFETARSAYRIGWLYLFDTSLSGLDEAEKWLLKAKQLFERNEIDTVEKQTMYCGLLENLSKVYSMRYRQSKDEADISQAEAYADTAVNLSRKWLAGYNRTKKSPAGSLLRLADVYMDKQDYKEAEKMIDNAARILSYMYSDREHSDADLLRASSRKAKVLYHLCRYEESLEMTDRNLAAYRELYGNDNPSLFEQQVLKIQNCLKLNRKADALEILNQSYSFPALDESRKQILDDLKHEIQNDPEK